MSLKLTSYCYDKDMQCYISTYHLLHTNNGPKGTTLALDIRILHYFGKMKIEILNITPEANDVESAMDKMAEWLERASIAIKERGASKPILDYN